ncbi:MAG: TolC family protein [Holosporaceae bacterium]|jgi:outer membrane protein|nr:TolC family protein [Holosporaceae bacterium]
MKILLASICIITSIGAINLSYAEEKNKEERTDKKNAEEETVTFEDALLGAYNNSKEWSARKVEKSMADEKLSQAKMLFLPTVSATFGASRTKTEARRSYYGVVLKEERKSTGTTVGVKLQQNVFNGFSTMNSIKAAEHESLASSYKLKIDEEKLILDVTEKYTAVCYARQKVLASKKMEENLYKTFLSQKSRLEVGYGTPADVAAANANYQKAFFDRTQSETELFSAESEFEKLTGLKVGKNMKLPELNIDLPKTLKELMAMAMKANNTILYTKQAEQAATKNLDATRGRLAPSCDLVLDAGRRLDKETMNDSRNTYNAAVEVTVPIVACNSNGNAYSAIELARQSELKTRFEAEDAIRETKKNCIVNWNTYALVTVMIKASRSAVQSAELSSEDNMEETNMGLKSNVDIWDKENRLLESRLSLADSQRKKVITAIRLEILTGRLNVQTLLNSIKSIR